MSNSPLVSVIIPIYNASRYLSDSINSILNQSMDDFELVLVDDGSQDDSLIIISKYSDPRIKLLKNSKNEGLAYSLNKGMRESSGEFIARMDADDIAHPNRLSKQVLFLNSNKKVGLLGTWMQSFEASSYLKKYPVNSFDCEIELLFEVPIGHPSAIFRRNLVEEFNLYYNEEYKTYGEDYDLWIRFSDYTKIANLGIPLLQYRVENTGKKSKDRQKRQLRADLLREQILLRMGISFTSDELDAHLSLSSPLNSKKASTDFSFMKDWIFKLKEWNLESQKFETNRFNVILWEKLFLWSYLNPGRQSFFFFLKKEPKRIFLLAKFFFKLLKS